MGFDGVVENFHMPFKVPKKEIACAGVIFIARTRYRAPRIPPTQRAGGLISLGGPPCPDLNYTGGRGNVPSISMPFGGSFEEIWPFFDGRNGRGITRGP